MLNPFDDSFADQFSQGRFSENVAAESADAREMMNAGLAAGAEIKAARRAEKYRKARQRESYAREDKLLRRQRSAQSSANRTSLVGAGIGLAGTVIGVL